MGEALALPNALQGWCMVVHADWLLLKVQLSALDTGGWREEEGVID